MSGRRKRSSISSDNSRIGGAEEEPRHTLNAAFHEQFGALENYVEGSPADELEAENEQLRQQIETALLPTGEGKLRYRDYELTSVGFQLPAGDAPPEHWSELGETIIALHGATQWLIGDWLLHDENNHWGATTALAEKYDLNLNTLYTYRKIAKSVPFGIRIPELSFGHHQVVAHKLTEAEQRQWLEHARDEGWSVAALRAALRQSKQPKRLPKPQPPWADRIAKVEEELAPERWQKLPKKERREALNQLRALLLKLEEMGG